MQYVNSNKSSLTSEILRLCRWIKDNKEVTFGLSASFESDKIDSGNVTAYDLMTLKRHELWAIYKLCRYMRYAFM